MGNNKQLVDLDKKQPLKDIYRRNQYKIDDRLFCLGSVSRWSSGG